MKKYVLTLACASALALASTAAFAQQMDPNMPGMAGMQTTKPTQAQGVGIVKAIDTTKGTITLQHQAITAIGWPAMTMTFKAGSVDISGLKFNDQVDFEFTSTGMDGTLTKITRE